MAGEVMRILVCGGRRYADGAHVCRVLDELHAADRITAVIQGGATGADSHARDWARRNHVQLVTYNAAWAYLLHPDAVIKTRPDGTQYDAKAGHRRNARMLAEGKPGLVVAFPGGTGTRDMMRQAQAAGVMLLVEAPR